MTAAWSEFDTTPVPMFSIEDAGFVRLHVAVPYERFLPKIKIPDPFVGSGITSNRVYMGFGDACLPKPSIGKLPAISYVDDSSTTEHLYASECGDGNGVPDTKSAVECTNMLLDSAVQTFINSVNLESFKAKLREESTRPIPFLSIGDFGEAKHGINELWSAATKRIESLYHHLAMMSCDRPDESGAWKKWDEKLKELHKTPSEWDSSCGPLPSDAAITTTEEFIKVIRWSGRQPSRLSRTVVGGVGVTFKQGSRKVYVEFRNTKTIHALYSDGSADPSVVRVIPDEGAYLNLISKIKRYLDE